MATPLLRLSTLFCCTREIAGVRRMLRSDGIAMSRSHDGLSFVGTMLILDEHFPDNAIENVGHVERGNRQNKFSAKFNALDAVESASQRQES